MASTSCSSSGRPLPGAEARQILFASDRLSRTKSSGLFHGVSEAEYADGYLLFMRESALMAQPFDLKNLELAGEPGPGRTADPVRCAVQQGGLLGVSENGLLLYQSIGTRQALELALFDSSGQKISSFGQPEIFNSARLSKDGKRIAMDIVDLQWHNVDLWLYEIARGIQTRFTFDPAADDHIPLVPQTGNGSCLVPTGRVHYDLYIKSTAGSAPEELLSDFGARDKYALSWSSDGSYILFITAGDPKTKTDLWVCR